MHNLFFLTIFVSLLLLSCGHTDEIKENLMRMQSSHISLPLSKMQCMYRENDTLVVEDWREKTYRVVIYSDSADCSSCVLDKLWIWNDKMKELKQLNSNLRFIFILSPRPDRLEDVYLSLAFSGLQSHVYVDTAFVFQKENPQIPAEYDYHTFLLNTNDSIVIVGNPIDNKSVDKLYKKLLNKNE